MKISERGILNGVLPGERRALSTFPSLVSLADGTLLASYRVGSTKDSDDETVELRRSHDGGRTWTEAVAPFVRTLGGKRGSLKLVYVTPIADEHLIAAAMWVDREAYPRKPLFNAETEGCLPITILLADSHDLGNTWTAWRVLSLPDEIGPPSLTSPILKLPSGKLAVSIETNKNYEDRSSWLQRVVYAYSSDLGNTWSSPVTVSQDPSGRIFNWDQRAGLAPDGRLVTFTWTYDQETTRYLNVHRRLSSDEGQTWTRPEDLNFADQPSHPAVLADGRVVLGWVDRFQTRSIRARLAEAVDAPFEPETELVLYQHQTPPSEADAEYTDTGDLLSEMGVWNFGLPFAEALPDGDVMVVYYAGTLKSMQVYWARLSLRTL